ncbi:MAG: hypothetical protein SGILL_010342, partial [Bacillariaceae sp.]
MSGQNATAATRKNLVIFTLVAVYLVLQLAILQQFWETEAPKKAKNGSEVLWAEFNRKSNSALPPSPPPQEIYDDLPPFDLQVEIQKAKDYVHSFQNIKRELAFVHIPKAAGSAIEEVAGVQAKIDWGSCLFRHKPKRPGGVCRYPPGQFEWPRGVGWWHLPPWLFPLMGTNPYEHADLFVVVRDVTERLVSEFYYACRKRGGSECDASRMEDPKYLNEWLKKQLTDRNTTSMMNAQDYLDRNGHFTPQNQFVVSPMGVRMVDYVIRMDTLQEEFPDLMQAYGLDIDLPNVKTNTDRNHSTDLGPKDIDDE